MSEIKEKIQLYPQQGKLPCAVAHYIAAELSVTPRQVGETANGLQIRITQCQLGLFGYGQKGTANYKILSPMDPMPNDLAKDIRTAAHEGRISCLKLWKIATQYGLSRHVVGNAADTLGLKVTPCQLGCF